MRLFCRGEVVEWDDGRFGGLVGRMGLGRVEGARAVVLLGVFKVGVFLFVVLYYLSTLSTAPYPSRNRNTLTQPPSTHPRSKHPAATACRS